MTFLSFLLSPLFFTYIAAVKGRYVIAGGIVQ